ncbi:zinc finger protein 862-like [Scomber scombrus]|uniref:Zinc finger protein 862-like n=1 Tax=Scomber scombrus TaxID=13677 RepID=A0AAV1MS53_SCOSC
MATREGSETAGGKVKKKRVSFKVEWLSQYMNTDEGTLVKLGDIFSFSTETGVVCKTCSDANVKGEFSEGKVWSDWKLDYLNRHVGTKGHLHAVNTVKRRKQGLGIGSLLQESAEERQKRNELSLKKKEENDVNCKTVFGGIVQLKACTAHDLVKAITDFYSSQELDLQKMVMLTSDGASVMLGKHNGVAALLKQQIPHLTEQHCVAHREDLGIDDAWKDVPLMRDVETLLRTIYSIFSRSSVKKCKFRELAEVLNEETLSFRPLNEVRWLSRQQAVNAVLRNYTVLKEYCRAQASDNGDPVAKYCYKKLSDPKYKVTLTALGDVLRELANLCLSLQRRNLTVMEGHCYASAKIEKLHAQYLENTPQWSDRVMEVIRASEADGDITKDITQFISKLCDHSDARFPVDGLKEWSAFDIEVLCTDVSFDYGTTDIAMLAQKYETILHPESMDDIKHEYADFKYIVKQKHKQGSIKTFSDMVAATLRCEELKEVSQLVDICDTFQASSADCERGFSLMNRIKTKSRNRLEVTHLDQLMRIKSRQEEDGAAISVDKVYNHWRSEKDRREK